MLLIVVMIPGQPAEPEEEAEAACSWHEVAEVATWVRAYPLAMTPLAVDAFEDGAIERAEYSDLEGKYIETVETDMMAKAEDCLWRAIRDGIIEAEKEGRSD